MRQTLQEQKNATVYQYRLVNKIDIYPRLLQTYKIAPFVGIAIEIILFGWNGLLFGLIGLPAITLLRFILNRLTLLRVDNYQRQRWGWNITIPYMGYSPVSEVKLGLYRKTELTMFWIGLCVLGALFPWIKQSGFCGLLLWHLWLAIPGLIICLKLRRQQHDGVVKLESENISYYHR
ncbi:hypothetical protein PCCS19_47450 [Paenibacillus sp. CCS19]|uniref:hypothetical protein n=1 Tax=Paenibacillus sp. CCS19 TaxID=3158387 RepID=UPI002566725E|nr:hypothetical protein [Paenibacillus cellulosilyticus]GMK41688.1 hypothetical protein PCCS19_47450 [Paenibacillus cellulosilyticus]